MRLYRTNLKSDLGEDVPADEIVNGFLASEWNTFDWPLTRSLHAYLLHDLKVGWTPNDPALEEIEDAILTTWRAARA